MRDTIEIAQEAGADTLMYWDIEKLKRFEALVRADEREACAKVCDDLHPDWKWRAAESIRARSNT
jgi:glutamine phosphoribosylpyrophosphate amidotransferase